MKEFTVEVNETGFLNAIQRAVSAGDRHALSQLIDASSLLPWSNGRVTQAFRGQSGILAPPAEPLRAKLIEAATLDDLLAELPRVEHCWDSRANVGLTFALIEVLIETPHDLPALTMLSQRLSHFGRRSQLKLVEDAPWAQLLSALERVLNDRCHLPQQERGTLNIVRVVEQLEPSLLIQYPTCKAVGDSWMKWFNSVLTDDTLARLEVERESFWSNSAANCPADERV